MKVSGINESLFSSVAILSLFVLFGLADPETSMASSRISSAAHAAFSCGGDGRRHIESATAVVVQPSPRSQASGDPLPNEIVLVGLPNSWRDFERDRKEAEQEARERRLREARLLREQRREELRKRQMEIYRTLNELPEVDLEINTLMKQISELAEKIRKDQEETGKTDEALKKEMDRLSMQFLDRLKKSNSVPTLFIPARF